MLICFYKLPSPAAAFCKWQQHGLKKKTGVPNVGGMALNAMSITFNKLKSHIKPLELQDMNTDLIYLCQSAPLWSACALKL